MLKIEHLTKSYGDRSAVSDLSLHIKKGEIYGFIGHNGAGKTTTIRSCAGILRFDAGKVYIDGISVKEKQLECKKLTAYIPDNPDLYEFYIGIKYLNFIADIYSIPQGEREQKVKKYADLFELTSDFGRLIGAYSHGMKQKLAVISALIHSPLAYIL